MTQIPSYMIPPGLLSVDTRNFSLVSCMTLLDLLVLEDDDFLFVTSCIIGAI